jgi:hypothetical protein
MRGSMWRSGLAILGVLVLAGCGQPRIENMLIACPSLSLPADVADLSRHRPGVPPDLSTLILDARIQALDGACRSGRRGESVSVSLAARFRGERGPASTERSVDLPWFIAVVEDGTDRIVNRQTFVQRVTFAPNTTESTVTSPRVELVFPVRAERRVQDHRIMVGFLLTQGGVAFNRARGPR